MLMQIGEEMQPTVFLPSLILYNVPVGEGGLLTPRLKIYLKKNNGWFLVFSSLWAQPRTQPVSRLQKALVLPVRPPRSLTRRSTRTSQAIFCSCC